MSSDAEALVASVGHAGCAVHDGFVLAGLNGERRSRLSRSSDGVVLVDPWLIEKNFRHLG